MVLIKERDNMKYEFIKIDDDTTELKYKDKSFQIRKDIELLKDLQSINFRAKVLMMNELKKMNMTMNDLVIVTKEGNKTYEDKTNLMELEQYCLSIEAEKIYDNITMKYTNMTLAQLLTDIGIEIESKSKKEIEDFTNDLNYAIVGKTDTPREEK